MRKESTATRWRLLRDLSPARTTDANWRQLQFYVRKHCVWDASQARRRLLWPHIGRSQLLVFHGNREPLPKPFRFKRKWHLTREIQQHSYGPPEPALGLACEHEIPRLRHSAISRAASH